MKNIMLSNLLFATTLAICMPVHADLAPDEILSLPGADIYPESMAQDSKTGKLFVGSFYAGDVLQIVNGKSSVFIPNSRDDIHSVVGIAVDSKRRRLWVCNSEAGASAKNTKETTGRSFVHVYNVDTGSLLKKIPLDNGGGHFCNDIAVSSDGSAYITDSFSPTIWKVGPELMAQAWLVNDQFKGEGFNLNGIQLTPDEKYLLVNKMNEGKIFRIGLRDKSVLNVTLDRPIEGGDGMQLLTSHMLLMVEGFGAKTPGIAKLTFTEDYSSASVDDKVTSGAFDTPTAVRSAGENVYVVNSRFNHLFKRDTYGPPVGPFSIVRFARHQPARPGAF